VHVPPLGLKQQGLVVHCCLVGLLILDVAVVLLQCVLLHLWRMKEPVQDQCVADTYHGRGLKVALNIHDKCIGVCDVMC